MKSAGRHFAVSGLLSVFIQLALSSPIVHAAEAGCEPSGQLGFVCGIRNAEDLVRIPHTKWILSSGMAADAGISLIDAQRKSWAAIYPGKAPRATQDIGKYGACPGTPDPNAFVSHGLNLRPGNDGHSTLYVVGHGGREAIEVFDVDANGEVPVMTWIGCVLTPDGMEANSVASLADGSLLATIPLHKGIPISDALAGKVTGGVYKWAPGDAGFTLLQGTELPYANGIEVSADEQEFYVVSSGLFTVAAYSNSNPARLLRSSEPFAFVPDNLHARSDGHLITAGLNVVDKACGDVSRSSEFSLEKFASCPRPFTVWAIDPKTMKGRIVASGPANERFSNITTALEIDGELWIGSFGSDRVGYRTLKGLD